MLCSFLPADTAAVFRASDVTDFNFSPMRLHAHTAVLVCTVLCIINCSSSPASNSHVTLVALNE